MADGLASVSERLKDEDLLTVYNDMRANGRYTGNTNDEGYKNYMAMSRLVPEAEFSPTELGITSYNLYHSVTDEELPTLTQAAQEIAERLSALYAQTAQLKDAFVQKYGVEPDTEAGRLVMRKEGISYSDLDTTQDIFREIRAAKGNYEI
ncbi:hypothetical protein EOL96_04270 [Candidatus Saccharibacteria bacterium]|nr:hypothetical protein [Candidatus Saccharibacteria bacterium]